MAQCSDPQRWELLVALVGQDWHEMKQCILFRAEEIFPINHALRQVMWEHCAWLRGNGAWGDGIAIISVAMLCRVRVVIAMPERTTIFEPAAWTTEGRFQLEGGHFTPCVLIDSSDSESDEFMEILQGGGSKRSRAEAMALEAAEEQDRVELEPEYHEATKADETVVISVLRTRYRWRQAFRGAEFGWQLIVRRGAAVELVRRAIARKLHIHRAAIFLFQTGVALVDFEQVFDNHVWTFEVHLDEAVPVVGAAAGSSTDGQEDPPPTISPTEAFVAPRPSVAPELVQPEEDGPEAQDEEQEGAPPPEDPPEAEAAEEEIAPPPRQRLSIELPSLFQSPPAAQRQRLRISLHSIGPIFLIVEEGFVPEDFCKPSMEPLTLAQTFDDTDSSIEWLVRGGGRGKAEPVEEEEEEVDLEQYKLALEKVKSTLVITNLPFLRMLLRGNAALVRRISKAGNGQQQLQLMVSAAKRVRAEAPVSAISAIASTHG